MHPTINNIVNGYARNPKSMYMPNALTSFNNIFPYTAITNAAKSCPENLTLGFNSTISSIIPVINIIKLPINIEFICELGSPNIM